jgi:peptidoglycan/xylan/chitin deacetylase (PgdA/CDA1 family)
MVPSKLATAYHWNYRPQTPRRPAWFTAWPGGNRIAVTINIMHEWESQPEWKSVRKKPAGVDCIDFLSLTNRQYGANFGFARLLDVLDRCGVKATVLCSGLMAEFFPATVKEAIDRGHEVACHHWDQSFHPFHYTAEREERDAVGRSLAAIEHASGVRPLGYMSPGPRPSPFTLEISAALGFKWNGDYCDSDVPYLMDVQGRKLVSLGYVRPAYTDNDVMSLGLAGALQQLKDEFDAHYEEAARHPMKFRLAVHNFTGGRPGLSKVVENFVRYVQDHPGVWFCRCIDMADYWLANSTS